MEKKRKSSSNADDAIERNTFENIIEIKDKEEKTCNKEKAKKQKIDKDDRDRRALSLCQPYAEAIIAGVKQCENRTKIIFRPKDGGEWIYIHASKSRPWELPPSIDDTGTIDSNITN